MQKAEWPEIPIGTIVALTGTLSTSASEPRLHIHSADSVYPQKKSETLFPRDISIDELTDNEVGSLITVDGEVIEKSGQNVYLTNDAEELRIFIAKNTDIDTSQIVEGSFISITGILSKTKTGWRLLPRSSEDIQTILVKGETEDSLTTSTTSEKQSLVYYLVATLITLLTGLLLVIYRLRTRERVSIAKTE
jgi:hypothetical protein